MVLKNLWYFAMSSCKLKKGQMLARTFFGEPILFARKSTGEAFAISDVCPHRGTLLHNGFLINDEVVCPYHGWKFNDTGKCTDVPSLINADKPKLPNICNKKYFISEQQNAIWIFNAEDGFQGEPPPPPRLPQVPLGAKPRIVYDKVFECSYEEAVMGLVDPAHTPWVHNNVYWRRPGKGKEKVKKYAPDGNGFKMVRHRPSSNSRIYKVLGGQPTTEINFQLPSHRIEHIQFGNSYVLNYLTFTPVDDKHARCGHIIYWDSWIVTLLWPLLKMAAYQFMEQDRRVLGFQNPGLPHLKTPRYVGQADQLAIWYQQLRKEQEKAVAEGREFKNPLRETELTWQT